MKSIALLIVANLVLAVSMATAQSPKNPRPPQQNPVETRPTETQPESPPIDQDLETIKIDTDLVTVPVIASSRTGTYIADLQKEEFKISEDGVQQQIAFFATVNAPFHVVLLLDTSASTQEKLGQIQQAAISFVDQLSSADKVKVISFESEVRDLNEFTGDKAAIRSVIKETRSGQGTRVYDAVQLALDMLRPVKQRRAIVIFTDGVDWHSQSSTFEDTIRGLDESGVIVYPIRFDTRADAERLARQQEAEQTGGTLPTSDVIRGPPTGTTPPTFPSDEPFPAPAGQPGTSLPDLIFGGRRRNPNPPTEPKRTDRFPDPDRDRPSPTIRNPHPDTRTNDSISGLLNILYFMADSYLMELAHRSGGQVYRADTVATLPQAFAAIAAELRTQYLLGYYPSNREKDGTNRKIQVKTSRKDISIRARPGYRARRG